MDIDTKILNYLKIQGCIEERLQLLTKRLNLLPNVAEYEYIHNLNRLKRQYPQETKTHYSRIMYKAYEQTVQYYERGVQ